MANRYNFSYFEAEFKKYLSAGKAEASTIKNYLSDLHYFFSWLQSTHHLADLDYSELSDVFSHSLLWSFQDNLVSSEVAPNTVLRRLATLRKFFTFCVEQRWMRSNPADDLNKKDRLDEREQLILSYRQVLKSKVSDSTDLERSINVIRDLVINSQQL